VGVQRIKNKKKIMGLGDRQRFTERNGGEGDRKFTALKVYWQCPLVLPVKVGWRQNCWK